MLILHYQIYSMALINRTYLKQLFRNKDIVFQLIIINVILFLFISIIDVGFTLFNLPRDTFNIIWNQLSLSAIPSEVLLKPWTLLTYMFMHSTSNFFHILINMLMLYWFGKIFLVFLQPKKLLNIYILGGLAGAAFYLLAYQFVPMLRYDPPMLGMVGASASVIAIMIATATLVPDYKIGLLFIGEVKLKYVAIFFLLIDLISLKGGNSGGHFAHLGGAVYGFLYIKYIRSNSPIAVAIGKFGDAFKRLFEKKDKSYIKYKKVKKTAQKQPSGPSQKEIDVILDKIAVSGYESLTDKEKEMLFNASKK
jgi:membrane associated rhomboid family serine protease